MARNRSRVVDTDHGWRQTVGRLQRLGALDVTVGVHEDAPPSEDGTPVAEYALVNEFGSSDGRIPERSFLRSTLDANQAAYTKRLADSLDQALDGVHLRVGLRRLGQQVVDDVRQTIESGVGPPNAPATVAKKGHGATLQDSGNLSDAITAKVEVVR